MRLAELEGDLGVKAELYRAAGRRWLDQFSNVQNAVEAFEKLHEARPDDREAVEKLKELYGKRRAYRQLYDLYDSEAKRTSGAERRGLWVEMAKMASDRLDRGADASRLYKMILAEDPDDAAALDALEKQAERDKDFATVAEVLERRVQVAAEPPARLAILQKLGTVYSDRLQDHAGALRVWRRVLDLSPGHAKALRILRDSYLAMGDYDGLTELYSAVNDWDGLAEVLSTTADRVGETQTKVDLSYRVAEIYEEKVGASERAFRSYERVLSVRPADRRAASALVPLYERDEKWARLPALYEVLLSHATDDVERRGLYAKLAEVTGERLSDKTAAFRYAKKAYELAPTERGGLAALEAWARASGEWGGLAQAIQTRLGSSSASVDERRELRMKLAEVSALHAGRPDDAVKAYKELIEANAEDEIAIAGLDRLLRSSPDRKDDLRWLFRLRVNRAEGRTATPLLAEWALLEEEAFSDAAKATEIYKELLGLDPDHPGALRALARLLIAQGDALGASAISSRGRAALRASSISHASTSVR
jgi:tetratricopeptide (TPR) repeat protein